jgi:tetratricopeptide (TPR) repeat protein
VTDPSKWSEFQEAEDANFRHGVRLRDQGRLEEAVEVFQGMANRYPRIPAGFIMLGGLYNELGRAENAASAYFRAVELSPRTELANRGLFNALWTLGREQEAIAVLRKYREITGSQAFDDILNAYDIERGRT